MSACGGTCPPIRQRRTFGTTGGGPFECLRVNSGGYAHLRRVNSDMPALHLQRPGRRQAAFARATAPRAPALRWNVNGRRGAETPPYTYNGGGWGSMACRTVGLRRSQMRSTQGAA